MALAYVLYRAIRRPDAMLSDFWSPFAHGEEPMPSQLRQPIYWTGISAFSDLEESRRRADEWMQGRFIARLDIPDDADIVVLKTGRNPYHYSVMGTPATLLSRVAQVVPTLEK